MAIYIANLILVEFFIYLFTIRIRLLTNYGNSKAHNLWLCYSMGIYSYKTHTSLIYIIDERSHMILTLLTTHTTYHWYHTSYIVSYTHGINLSYSNSFYFLFLEKTQSSVEFAGG